MRIHVGFRVKVLGVEQGNISYRGSILPYLPAASLGFMGLGLRVRDLGWRVCGRTLMVCLLALRWSKGLIP